MNVLMIDGKKYTIDLGLKYWEKSNGNTNTKKEEE